jgi:hypothetical protein
MATIVGCWPRTRRRILFTGGSRALDTELFGVRRPFTALVNTLGSSTRLFAVDLIRASNRVPGEAFLPKRCGEHRTSKRICLAGNVAQIITNL